MKKSITLVFALLLPLFAAAQAVDSTATPTFLTLEDALRIALSENASVKVADMEIQRTGYARKGTYASLFPQINGSGSYQRTIKKQVMYMDFDIGGMGSMAGGSAGSSGSGDSGDAATPLLDQAFGGFGENTVYKTDTASNTTIPEDSGEPSKAASEDVPWSPSGYQNQN